MNKIALRALKTLVKIRLRRQKKLDERRSDAQNELKRLGEVVNQAYLKVDQAKQNVSTQIEIVDQMLMPGNTFNIDTFVAQQDYVLTLGGLVDVAETERTDAENQVEQQKCVVLAARRAASANIQKRERLEERIKSILEKLAVQQLDNEDEEAEENVVTRKHSKDKNALQEVKTSTYG
jgi:hypothetical protein